MKCPKCQKPVIVESLGEGKISLCCQYCGHAEIKDPQGRKLLTDTKSPDPRRILMG